MANGISRLAGVERISTPTDGAILWPVVWSIGKEIHARSHARTVFNREVLSVHFEDAYFASVGRCFPGRGEKALQGRTMVERTEKLFQNEVQRKGSLASHF
jgi:hypothetical protein